MFVFASFLEGAIQQQRITPATLGKGLRLEEGDHSLDLTNTYSSEELQAESRNLMLITLGTTAISTNRALEIVYGKRVNPNDTSPEGSARVLLYQIRCAFAHDPLNPIWAPHHGKYNRQYELAFKTPTDEPITYHCKFNPSLLDGKPLKPKHIGGMKGYLGLLHYFLANVEAHPKGTKPYASSRL